MMFFKKLLTFFPLICGVINGQYFKTNTETFLQKIDNEWVDFGQFAAVNLGITNPGYLPGQVILTREDYLRRFERLDKLGIKVIRVYALLHPDFYETLLEWNENHTHIIYVLHGTAFPEIEMEENNGTDAFDEHVTEIMKDHIERTVKGVYGRGEVMYTKYRGVTPVFGDYKSSIAEYLLGWVVAGEMSPHAVNRTNNEHIGIEKFEGNYISTKDGARGFEVWISQMLDHVATLSMETNNMAPISHTNWATTDGIDNLNEPRFPSSVEDWQDIDLHYIDTTNWDAGMYFNQHAYPYYPDFLSLQENGIDDPYLKYITRLREYYNELPFVLTEFGLSTSMGVASYEHFKERNHGHISHKHQGEMMKELMISLINDIGVTGVCVFQLHDEWFKKSWNTLLFEPTDRNYWLNVMSAEQGFGIFEVKSYEDINEKTIIGDDYLKDIKISNDESYLKIDINIQEMDKVNIIIGIDNLPSGSNSPQNIGINKIFENEVDSIIQIDTVNKKVSFNLAGCHSDFYRHYGEWLSTDDNLVIDNTINDITNPTKGLFFPFIQLIRLPGYMPINTTVLEHTDSDKTGNGSSGIWFNHEKFTLEYQNEADMEEGEENLALWKQKEDGNYEIKIPYAILGYSNPSSHTKNLQIGQGREFEVIQHIDDTPINIEIAYLIDDMEISEIKTTYTWESWEIPKCYQEKPKKSVNYFRQAFMMINRNLENIIDLTEEELEELSWHNCNEIGKIDLLHTYLVQISFIFLALCFFYSSIGKFLFTQVFYCYSFQKPGIEVEGSSSRLSVINFVLLVLLGYLYYLDLSISTPDITVLYIIYILLIIWDSLIIFMGMILFRWNLYEVKELPEYDANEHVFIISCHNSSDVLGNTLRSLIAKVNPETIYVGDNGSSEIQQKICNKICYDISKEWYKTHKIPFNKDKIINYGHSPIGNKTISQFASVSNLPLHVKYVTCIDDDTRLHETWDVNKVLNYFVDEEVTVLAYPLKADKPHFDVELFQALEYIIVGFIKICHGKVRSTIFNSGAFGTYRVEILKEAFQYHNTDFHGDDLQICLNIHQLKGKKFLTQEEKFHVTNYRVVTATDMVVSTIVPKCWIHLRSVSRILFPGECTCDNPDLFGQRAKGWFVSKHRFIPKYAKFIFNCKGIYGIWVRIVALYDLIMILNEYFAIFYIIFILENIGFWMIEAFIIGMSFNIFTMLIFNYFILKKNKLNLPVEAITTQPIIYKVFMITIYRYMGLLYNLFIYTPTHRTGDMIKKRLEDESFRQLIKDMYVKREVEEDNSSHIIEISEEVEL